MSERNGRRRPKENGAAPSPAPAPPVVAELARELPELIPQPNGDALLAGGVVGHRGGSGRPPDEFKLLLASLASRARTVAALSKILKDKDHPLFMKALQYASDRGYPELALAIRAATVNYAEVNVGEVHIWRIGDREIRF